MILQPDIIGDAIARKPVVRVADLRAADVYDWAIKAAIDSGKLVRLYRGVVAAATLHGTDGLDEVAAYLLTGGVIWGLSAAQRHDLCDALPARLQLIVPNSTVRVQSDLPAAIFRSRDPEAMTLGVDQITTEFGMSYLMTSPARTVVDLYRPAASADRQHALAALTTYLGAGGEAGALRRIAKAFGLWDRLRPEVEVTMEMLDKGSYQP